MSIKSKNQMCKWTRIGIAALVIAIIVLAVILIIILTKPQAIQTVYTIDYKLETENGSVIEQDTKDFTQGTIAQNLGFKTSKLDEELGTVNKGESKTIYLEAKDAYGEYDEDLKFTYSRVEKEDRVIELNRTIWIAITAFNSAFNEEPQLNKVYTVSQAPWPVKVIDMNSSHVKLSLEATLNQEIPSGIFSYWPSKVINLTDTKIILKLEGNETVIPTDNGNVEITFTETEIIATLTPEIGQEVQLGDFPKARVTEMNSSHLFLDSNHKYAGEKIIVKMTIKDIKTIKNFVSGAAIHIPGSPTLQLFIMSYCPYGLQALKGVLPIWEKFQGKANIELRFVSYTMHGEKEDTENARMICIREEQSNKLIPYLKCFVEAGDAAGCITSTGIDASKLNECMKTKASQYMEEDNALNKQYGVRGSPTFILNGQEVNIYPRDPQSIATAICNAFTGSKPSVCSETFSTKNPSPGFGGGSSSSSGSCG